ncbi:MAG: hypothetical protein WA485_00365 [Candidatus Sulfotelmatobacter sp.]
MANQPRIRKLIDRIRRANRRLIETHADPCNADRALWGALAVTSFASVTGQSEEVAVDPETVLGDLLAGLMHWCDAQKTNDSLEESIDFESALERARNHYKEECSDEREQLS